METGWVCGGPRMGTAESPLKLWTKPGGEEQLWNYFPGVRTLLSRLTCPPLPAEVAIFRPKQGSPKGTLLALPIHSSSNCS